MNTQQEQFSVHKDPAWQDRMDFVINAALPETGRYEQLPCRQLDDEVFEVCCIPFFLYDVALGDIVRTTPQGHRKYILSGVDRPSGRFVFRAHFGRTALGSRDDVVSTLTSLGALIEWSSASLLAVDARGPSHAQEIANYLLHQENLGLLTYETGKSA